jgi:hypothetical protein
MLTIAETAVGHISGRTPRIMSAKGILPNGYPGATASVSIFATSAA